MSCAWVVLVMLRDEYACGAAVVAQSLRQAGTKYPIWCAYADITAPAVNILRAHFDNVVEVPLLTQPCVPMKTAKQQIIYGSWIEHSFTKWNIMNPELFPLERVCLLDADVNVLSSIDDIFDMSAPAATFSSPWVGPYVPSVRGRALNAGNPYADIVDGKAVELDHGAIVDPARIVHGLDDSICAIANMVLLEPSQRAYDAMISELRAEPRFGSSACMSGHDEQLLARTWLTLDDPITNIHQEYNWCVGKTAWLKPGMVPKTHQFYNGKPWRGVRGQADRAAIKYDDVTMWWAVADALMTEKPEWVDWFYRGWEPIQTEHPSSFMERPPKATPRYRPQKGNRHGGRR